MRPAAIALSIAGKAIPTRTAASPIRTRSGVRPQFRHNTPVAPRNESLVDRSRVISMRRLNILHLRTPAKRRRSEACGGAAESRNGGGLPFIFLICSGFEMKRLGSVAGAEIGYLAGETVVDGQEFGVLTVAIPSVRLLLIVVQKLKAEKPARNASAQSVNGSGAVAE